MPAADTFTRERELTTAIVPTVESSVPGVEVLAVELLSPSRFCVYVDHPQGVDFALCERVTRVLDAYRSDWTIDVSSPGPQRPLRRPRHFAAQAGRRVQIRTAAAVAGKTRFRGEVLGADDNAVVVSVDGQALPIPVETIVRGNLIDEDGRS
jgi:ribosome maturation factor RimP